MKSIIMSNYFSETYTDALERLEVLGHEEYAFTGDSDDDAASKAKKVESQFRTKKLKVSQNTKDTLLNVPQIDSDCEDGRDTGNGLLR